MSRKRRAVIISAISVWVLTAIIVLAMQLNAKYGIWEILAQFQSFRVTVHNQSDHKLIVTEAGVTTGPVAQAGAESKARDEFERSLGSGQTMTIKPELSFIGEGGIYLKYTDSREPDTPKTIGVCSYTESVSGSSTVIITNDGVTVEENCS